LMSASYDERSSGAFLRGSAATAPERLKDKIKTDIAGRRHTMRGLARAKSAPYPVF
jgi:hypothetical protein